MPKKKTSEIDQIEAVRGLVDAYRRIYKPKGIDLDKILADFAAYVAHRLASPGARTDFEKLCKSGCVPQVLAAIVVSLPVFVGEIERGDLSGDRSENPEESFGEIA